MYLFHCIPLLEQMNSTNTIEPIGRILLETRKSKKSRIPVLEPIIWTSDKTLKPSIGSKLKAIITTKLITTALILLHLNSSIQPAIELSNTAIMVETAAISMNRKNRLPQMVPNVIFEKTTVMVMNSRLGPASGLMP